MKYFNSLLATLILLISSSVMVPNAIALGETHQCEPGQIMKIKSEGTVCKSCPPNTYSPGGRSGSCTGCPPGAYSSRGASSCSQCPVGSYSDRMRGNACTVCPTGKTTSGPGAYNITSCNQVCPNNTYWTPTGHCQACPSGTATLSGAQDGGACLSYTNDEARWGAYEGSCPKGSSMKKIKGQNRCKCKSGSNWSSGKQKCT